jgi:hypothetical protein
MKHALLVLLVACGGPSNPPAGSPPAPATATRTAARSDTPPLAPTTATPPADSRPPSPALPAVNCAAQDEAEYCAHVHDACCGSNFQGWVCNNARYVDWFAAQCPKP